MAAKKRGRPRRIWYRKLRQTMAALQVTIEDLAAALSIDSTTVSRKLGGRSDWHLGEAYAVMDYLGLPREQLYLYFPLDGEDVESVQHQHVREYLAETQQSLVPTAALQALSTLVAGLRPDTL